MALTLCNRFLYISLFIFGVGCGQYPQLSERSSVYEPHKVRSGPWFEGWYARMTDKGGKRSLAVVVGSHVPEDHNVTADLAKTPLPGYVGVLLSEGNGSPTRSWSFFPEKTYARVNGQEVSSDPLLLKRSDAPFTWEAPGTCLFENRRIRISIPGEVEVDMDFHDDGRSWNESGFPLGPEGYLAPLPVPLHWFVKSLNATTVYRVKTWDPRGESQELSGTGSTHLEKNWGAVFPKAWNWMQATDHAASAHLVVGGGTLRVLGIDVKAWLMGYRSDHESWDIRFSDPGTTIEVSEDSCKGTFRARAKRLGLEVEIASVAPPGSFGPVAVPTDRGFVPDLGKESFSAQINVKTYRPGLRGLRLTDQMEFHNGALEFGAGSYLKSCPTP